jgi:hypothetical protein
MKFFLSVFLAKRNTHPEVSGLCIIVYHCVSCFKVFVHWCIYRVISAFRFFYMSTRLPWKQWNDPQYIQLPFSSPAQWFLYILYNSHNYTLRRHCQDFFISSLQIFNIASVMNATSWKLRREMMLCRCHGYWVFVEDVLLFFWESGSKLYH